MRIAPPKLKTQSLHPLTVTRALTGVLERSLLNHPRRQVAIHFQVTKDMVVAHPEVGMVLVLAAGQPEHGSPGVPILDHSSNLGLRRRIPPGYDGSHTESHRGNHQ